MTQMMTQKPAPSLRHRLRHGLKHWKIKQMTVMTRK
jgi:hypothetical protein